MPGGLLAYLALAGLVFGVNLLPAFGPPTWAVLVFFRLNSQLAAVPLVLVGALAAASGRLVLAHASRHFRSRLHEDRRESLDVLQDALTAGPARSVAGLAVFAISPVPSAQLFVAAGLMNLALLPLTAVFFSGRLVSYSLYVAAASAAKHSLQSIFAKAFSSPWAIALQILMLAGLVLLVRVDWTGVIGSRRRRPRRQTGATEPSARPTPIDRWEGGSDERD